MKLSILIASLASLSGALADRVDLWERPNFRGPHATYAEEGIMAVPFVFRSYSWHRTEGSTCCAGFCKGNMTVSIYCTPNSRSDFALGADRVIIRCDESRIDCKNG
ncbi:hypothetical protein D8B26_001662 [Coccidioides posadasii str. Silveira]|uniref:uncharacterized protein n=1 Tax=Coccidioides posadasii (strain RMSCC 757 / Silveira) TaxID=443226 RepID=UPI001BF07D4B|nr:hypothetical protein D8B26_001662 [Coccidioides posadasii str. Silveira]